MALQHELLDRRAFGFPDHVRHQVAKTLSSFFLEVEILREDHGDAGVARVPGNLALPRNECTHRSSSASRIANRPAHGFNGLLGAVDPNYNDRAL